MPARVSAFVVWALVAASVAFWGLKLIVRSPSAPPQTVAVADGALLRGDITRVLGAAPMVAAPIAPGADTRFKLSGIVASRSPAQGGVALIAVDGKMPRAFRVGGVVDDQWVLQSVDRRTASIGPAQGAAAVVLELPLNPPPATGSLPPPATYGSAAAPVPFAVPTFASQPVPAIPGQPPLGAGLPNGAEPRSPPSR